MCDPQVRFCERPGGESPRAYSTPACGPFAGTVALPACLLARTRSAAQAVSCQEMEVVYSRPAWLSYAGEAHELVPRQVAESVAMERSVGDA